MRKKSVGIGVVLILLVVLGWGLWSRSSNKATETSVSTFNTAAAELRRTVEVVPVSLYDLSETLSFHGKLMAESTVSVSPKVSGRIVEVRAKVGDRVEEGQLLVQLETDQLRLQVEQAKAALEGAKANLQRLQEGARPEEIAQAKANVQQANANYANVKLQYDRSKKLYESGVLTGQEWDAIQAQLRVAEAQKIAAEKSLDLIEKGARDTDLQAAAAAVRQAEVALASAELQLEYASITSPISGVVGSVTAEVGNMSTAGMPVAVVVDMDRLELVAQVGEREVVKLHAGQPVTVELNVFPGRVFHGVVETVAPAADLQTGLFAVTIAIDNPDGVLRPGMYATAHVTVATKNQVVAIPETALLTSAGRTQVFVIKGDRAEERVVAIGMRDGSMVEIVDGLEVGEMVVVSGQEFLRSGDLVEVIERSDVK